ncbi:DUF4136 domain-containing protein [Arthrobacter sp. ISL-28]|uniref:DUF4136 domain-containing protein n=1 Tax=Arthrobacter sp. ISL-28 TaxID=2819108 RepID=UPI001BEB1314|nr:DUF4136 domain-containing protein [Arthrobacter sp. ISL-28]MBT2523831.1 hypothetical protein [Arthrobacter sp. ISL-28]
MSVLRRAVVIGLFVVALLVMVVVAWATGSFLRVYGGFTSGALQALQFGLLSLIVALPLIFIGIWAARRARWSLIAGAAVLICGIAAVAIAGEIGINTKRASSSAVPPTFSPVCRDVLANFTPPEPYAVGTQEDTIGGARHCQTGLNGAGTSTQTVLASYRRQMQDKGWQLTESGSTITGTHDGVTLVVDGTSGTLVWLRITVPTNGNP